MEFQDLSDNQSELLKQSKKQDINDMRSTLLSSEDDAISISSALKNITVLRIHHQISRIIQYTELMDKLEDKLYSSLSTTIEMSDVYDDETWAKLLMVQEKLQHNMIESMKLIQPYLDLTQYVTDVKEVEETTSGPVLQLDSSKREQLRTSAKNVLKELNVG